VHLFYALENSFLFIKYLPQQFHYNIDEARHITDMIICTDYFQEMVLFLEAFLAGGLFVGSSLPHSLNDDVSFSIRDTETICQSGRIKTDMSCSKYCPIP